MVVLTAEYREQGTPLAGYEERGPYHCEDCIHKVHANVPICVHPVVIRDPAPILADNRCWTDNPQTDNKGVFINLKRGCCKYVKQQDPDEKDG